MKILRFLHPEKQTPRWGLLHESEMVVEIQNPFSFPPQPSGQCFVLSQLHLLSPTRPTKIVAVGLNYQDHIVEFGHSVPENPIIFIKPSSSVIGPGEPIILPESSKQVDYEAELAVVIKKRAHHVPKEEAPEYILGYTCFNDVTARDLQKKDGQWTRAKSFDTFSPMGPWIETDFDPGNATIQCYLNGNLKQHSNTCNLLFSVWELVSFVSQVMTLFPGDVIATGTPSGVGPLHPGDVVEVKIEGIGILRNEVRKESCIRFL
ncbi:MAG: fumarylacetoacetate hydrolase family protein [Atribacterota bacterium]|nr:fumarylacetoacetate hydrolase family protein [Atribacterota bacterium]